MRLKLALQGGEDVNRREIRDTSKEIPFIDVADSNEPHIESVVTEFDTEQ